MKHPNALVGGVGGSIIGGIITYGCAKMGFHPSVKQTVTIEGAVVTCILFVGKNGLEGTLAAAKKLKYRIIHGSGA